ncbi:MAG: metallophosphoesterase family protein [Bryobacteraceae bacterium]|nr:metallophosphoesterase family protein [Bryobacteraceae bacterium]
MTGWRAWALRLGLAAALGLALFSNSVRVSDEVLHAPSAMPDRVILTWSGDPATTQSVTWRTSVGVEGARAQIAEAGDGPDFTKQSDEVKAASELLKSDLGEAAYHSVTFQKLKPSTVYAYRVGDGTNWTEWHQFRTASDKPAPVEFLYVGDAQNDILSLWSRVVRTGYREASKAHFFIHAGDLVNRGTSDALWGEWFRAGGWLNATLPSVPVPGNHEYGRTDGKRTVTDHWRRQYTLPENGAPGLEETSYYIDIQGVRIVGLNSNEKHEEQAQWLDALLEKNPNRWTICTFHHPIFSTARGRDNKELRELWQPVFDKHGVDLVLQGHDHSYGRSNLLSGTNNKSGGTVYVVSVSGPKMYELDRHEWMQRKAEDTQLFQIIRIDGDRLQFESRTARGALYDAFELRKQTGGPNVIVNKAPEMPERLRKPAATPSGD